MKKLLGCEGQGLGEQLRAEGRRLSPLARWALLGLLLLAFALRTRALGEQELRFDEVASFFIANRGPLELLTYVRGAIREHPPLYYALLSLWMPLAGRSEFAIRFLSVVVGMVTVAAIYWVLKRSARQPLALLGTLLLAVSPFHIRISRDARMYGLLTLWTLLSIHAFVALLGREPAPEQKQSRSSPPQSLRALFSDLRRRLTTPRDVWAAWGLFWLVTGLGMFTHYFMAFVLLAEDLYVLLTWRRHRRLLPPWLAIHAALGGAMVLWAVLSPGLWATLISVWNRGAASAVRWQALARGLNGLYLGTTQHPNWYHLGLGLIVTALGLLPFKQREPSPARRPGRDGLLRGLLLGVPIIAVLALPERVSGRYLTPALPASILAMAVGLEELFTFLKDRLRAGVDARLRALAASLVPLGLLGGLFFVDVQAYPAIYSRSGESFRAKTEYLNAHARADDGLLLHGPWQNLLLSYYDVESLRAYTIPMRDLKVDASRVDATLSQIFETHERVWVSYDSVEPVDPDWIVSRWLHEHAHQALARGSLTLCCRTPERFDIPDPSSSEGSVTPPHPLERLDVPFGEQLELMGVALSNTELTTGEAVLLLSQWRALREIPPGLSMRLELVGPGDQVWEHYQFSAGPAHVTPQAWDAGDMFVERRGLVVPVGTPPGDYQVRVRVLSPEGVEWLPADGPCDVGVVRVQHHAPPTKEAQALPGRDVQVDFEGRISLIGYAPWGHDFTQGNPLLFDIYWQALDAPDADYELEIEVLRNHDLVMTKKRVPLVADWRPTSSWEAEDVLKGHYAIPLPTDTPAGHYQIRLAVIAPDGSSLTMEGSRTHQILGRWQREEPLFGTSLVLFGGKIKARTRRYRAPAMDHRVDVVLSTSEGEEKLRLLGYDLASGPRTGISVEPGGALELTLYWKTLSRMERVYAVFNHMSGPDGTPLAQQDGWPQDGAYHTSQWLPGEVVEDHYTIQVPSDAPAGEYPLRVGMYDAATGERLLVTVDGKPVPERHAELTTVTVAR